MIIKHIVIQIQNLKTVQIDLLEIKALYFFVRMVTSFLFSGLRIRRRFFCFFFFKIEKKNFYRLFIFILSSNVTILSSLILKQGVQGLQAFAFCILTVNDEHTKQT